MTKKYPVLDMDNRDAEIIGYASTEDEANEVLRQSFVDAGSDEVEMAEAEERGDMMANFRPSALNDRYDNIDLKELADGYYAT